MGVWALFDSSQAGWVKGWGLFKPNWVVIGKEMRALGIVQTKLGKKRGAGWGSLGWALFEPSWAVVGVGSVRAKLGNRPFAIARSPACTQYSKM